MNGARFVHDRLELAGWQVEIADAQKVKGLAPLACKTDRIDAWVLAELADGANEALGVGVRLRRADRCLDHRDAFATEDLVEGAAELAVAVVDQKSHAVEQAREAEVARWLGHPGPSGWSCSPPCERCGLSSSMKKST